MKILRKNDEFRKMPEKNVQEVLVVKNLLNQGWKYCSRQEYKDFTRGEKVKVKETEKVDEPVKRTTKADKKKSERR